jgi:predicted dehydrogenase
MKKEKRLLRVGVLGCGPISQAAHLEAALKARNAELYAVCDVAEDLVQKIAARFEPRKTFSNYEAMLADPKVEAIIVAIADQFHVDAAIRALKAGKHVLVEKPLGTTIRDCERLAAEAGNSGLITQVGTMKRFDPGIRDAQLFLAEEGGEILALKAWYCDSIYRYIETDNLQPVMATSAGIRRPKGNPKANLPIYYLLGHGSHLFDTALFLGGPIRALRATLTKKFDSLCWMITAEFEGNFIGHLDLTMPVRMGWHEGFQVYAAGGCILARTHNPWYFRSSEVECFSVKNGATRQILGADAHSYKLQLEGFADTVLHRVPQHGATADDGTHVVRALTAVSQACRTGERVVLADLSVEEIV